MSPSGHEAAQGRCSNSWSLSGEADIGRRRCRIAWGQSASSFAVPHNAAF